jgi:macrolide-specific efflux system membrane fusion protein
LEESVSPLAAFHAARRSPVVIAIVIAVLSVSGSVAYAMTRSPAASTGPALTTTLVAASTGTMKETVSTSGTIAPATESDLSFAVSGQVTAVKVVAGDKVKKGQTLATVDSASLIAAVAEAQATVAADQARVTSDGSSNSATSAQLAADQAALSAAENQLTDARASLSDATLTAPISGTVTTVNLTVGQQVSSGANSAGSGAAGTGAGGGGGSGQSGGTGSSTSASSTSSSTSAQVVVVSTGRFIVNATVDDTQVAQVKKGLEVTVTPTSATTPVYGTVASVGLVPSSTSGTVAFPVVVDVTGTQTGLYGGMSATLSILVSQLSNVLEVPTQAVHYAGSTASVTVDNNGSRSARTVTVGLTANGMTQITGGLKAGEKVVTTTVQFNRGTGGTGGTTRGGTGGTGGAGGFGRGGAGTGTGTGTGTAPAGGNG